MRSAFLPTLPVLLPILAAASLAVAPLAAGAERPNIVFILADDLGYGDVAAFGGAHNNIDTPHFDALCAEGMKFTDAQVTNTVCVPSRISIMTGRYALRFGPPEPGGPWGFLGPQLPPDSFTLGRLLQRAGYATGYVGKWHLGTRMATRDGAVQGPENTDFTKPLEAGPGDYGFQASFILPGSLDMFPYAYLRDHRWVGQVTAEKGCSAFNRLGPAAEDFEFDEALRIFCDEAEAFIAAQAERGTPFFLYLGLTAPHTPTEPAPEFVGKSRIGIYGDFVMETDACIGRVVAALERHGFADDTLVIATSDHGPGHYSGPGREAVANQIQEMEAEGHRANGPWRGYKFSVFEGGTRVPFAAKWPGTVPAGSVCDALVGLQDLFATWAEIAGVELADDEAPDSISFLPLLKDPAAAPPRTAMVVRGTRGSAYREGPWKLLLCPGSGSAGPFSTQPDSDAAWRAALKAFGRKPESRAELEQPPFLQLYHLGDDLGETNDLAAEHPERVAAMIASFREILVRGRSTPGPALENDRELQIFEPVPGYVWGTGSRP